MALVTIKTFENSVSAHILKSKLESEGIKCFIFDENMITNNMIYNISVGGIKLKIDDTDLTKANKIITKIEDQPLTNENNDTIKCPNCQSSNLIANYKSIKGIKGFITFIIALLLMIIPFYQKKVFKCSDCKHEFKTT